jgi:hypothetical protein
MPKEIPNRYAMDKRRFGKTELKLAVFSLGTMRCLGSPQIMAATVNRALELGINHLETAPSYGKSEVYLGQALKNIPRQQFFLTSKVLPVDNFAEIVAQSLNRLGVDYLDCLAIHGINTFEHLQWVEKNYPALMALKAAGKFRHLGFSSHGSLELVLATLQTQFFAFANLHYYYFDQRLAPAIALAHQLDLGIFIISPADKGGQLHTPPPSLEKLCQPLSPLELGYRFLLSDPRITTLSWGAAHPGELEPVHLWGQQTQPLSVAEEAILESLQRELEQKLGAELCRQCYACLPCPELIPIPTLLRLRNLAMAYDMNGFAQYRYQMLERAGHWFPGRRGDRCTDCGDCLPRCPQQLNIPALVKDAHRRFQGPQGRRLWEL